MKKQIFDTKQEELTCCSTGRVFICVNELEVQVAETKEAEEGKEPETEMVTKYQYDTAWIRPVNQKEDTILRKFKEEILDEIWEYDYSDAVNSFVINGITMWLHREERVALKNRLLAEQAAGKTNTVIWNDTTKFEMTIEQGLQLLSDLEVYASQCYDVTAQHKVDINNCETIAEVGAYDITAGYPANPSFTI